MKFNQLGLIKPIMQAIDLLGYKEPSPIQAKAIPQIMAGHNLLASAETGTGKTASFAIPLLEFCHQESKRGDKHPKVLILTPTRELAAQVFDNIEKLSKFLPVRALAVFGGMKIYPQIRQLRRGVDILIATPGRLMDLQRQNAVNLGQIKKCVLDEADRMLDMGFLPDINLIMQLLKNRQQTLLFSATFSKEIRKLSIKIAPRAVEVNAQEKMQLPEVLCKSFTLLRKSKKQNY